jgi:hypothetical protein
MQKVITITRNISLPANTSFYEVQFPDLQKLLDEGYIVKDHILTVLNNSTHYAITFILEKK